MEEIYDKIQFYLIYLRIGTIIGMAKFAFLREGEIDIEREVVQAAIIGRIK